MKYLLILGVVLVVLWVWRSGQDRRNPGQRHADKSPSEPVKTEVVECDVCHVHLPRSDALIGNGGTYCSDAHRLQANRRS
jgi:uncharacterized protein